jgi:16S rRNA C1402 (ribose-2'-O) methylase RsmI
MGYNMFTLNKNKFKKLISKHTITTLKEFLSKYDTIFCEDTYSQKLLNKLNIINYKSISSYLTYKSLYLTSDSYKDFKYNKKHKICLYLETLSNFTTFEKHVGNKLIDKTSKNKIIKHFERRFK